MNVQRSYANTDIVKVVLFSESTIDLVTPVTMVLGPLQVGQIIHHILAEVLG